MSLREMDETKPENIAALQKVNSQVSVSNSIIAR
jgi:hypothetical protein